jgi:hypothetical protein
VKTGKVLVEREAADFDLNLTRTDCDESRKICDRTRELRRAKIRLTKQETRSCREHSIETRPLPIGDHSPTPMIPVKTVLSIELKSLDRIQQRCVF